MQEGGQIKDKNATTSITTKGNKDVVVIANECIHIGDNMVEWVVDTSASYHLTPIKSCFSTYKVGNFGIVNMGNATCSSIARIGNISIKINIKFQLTLKDVRHLLDLCLKLMSINAFDKEGFHNHFGGKLKLSKGFSIIVRV